jgi:hypothetical protein
MKGTGITAFIPEGGPDQTEGGDDFVGIDFFAVTVERL